jgi:hypothetical protein
MATAAAGRCPVNGSIASAWRRHARRHGIETHLAEHALDYLATTRSPEPPTAPACHGRFAPWAPAHIDRITGWSRGGLDGVDDREHCQ